MDKLMIEVYIPSIYKSYDMLIPRNITVLELTYKISSMIEELSDMFIAADSPVILCNEADGNILNINKTIEESNIYNCSKLILI